MGGGIGTRVSKFNLKIVIPVVLVVAALGGFYIFQKSNAASWTVAKSKTGLWTLSNPNNRHWNYFGEHNPGMDFVPTGPSVYRICAKLRATKGKSSIGFNPVAFQSSAAIPQSTNFTYYCSKTFSPGKDQRSTFSPAVSLTGDSPVEVQVVRVERM